MFTRFILIFTIIAVTVVIPATAGGEQSKSKDKSKASVLKVTDRLVEIDRKDLEKLKSLYTPDGVKSYIGYMTISNYIRWLEQNPRLENVKFYSLNGDFSDGTFVVTDGYAISADTFNWSHDRLYRLLLLIDYSKGYFFMEVPNEIEPTIELALKTVNVEFTVLLSLLHYYLPKEAALKFDVQAPEGIELRPLRASHIEKVISVYPRPRQNFLAYLKQIAIYNLNVGAFERNGTLVAWILRFHSGLLGVLQTDEAYIGKAEGYAGLLVRYQSKKIAEMGHDVHCGILENNIPSRSLFDKHGFKPIGKLHRIATVV